MASFGLISETAKDTFSANRATKAFANIHVQGAAPHITGIHFPIAQILPQYLKEHKYQDMNNLKDLPFQKALKTELEPFEYLKQDPEQMKALGHVMVLDGVQSWATSYPVERELKTFTPAADSAVLVDIGGGFGQHSVFFKEKFPTIPGRIVVQDLPSTLTHLPAKPAGIEFEEHDFFTPQTIRGAKFYYLRHIMIDDVVLPETKVPWQVSMMVMSMMVALGGIERSQEDWETLLDKAGLKVAHIDRYDEFKFHSIVAAVPK
jgi:demethylsterigmatocystin 6-O-methyltransferase